MFVLEEKEDITILHFPEAPSPDLSSILRDELRKIFQKKQKKIILNMKNFIGTPASSLLSVFLAAWEKAKEMEGSLVFCHLSPAVQEIFQVTEIGEHLKTYPTLEEAIASFEQ